MNEDSSEQKAHRIIQVIARIPKGKVATYGQVAALAGVPRGARFVAYTLKTLPEKSKLPWFRVLKSGGVLAQGIARRQRERLVLEGVSVVADRVSLKAFQWQVMDE